MTLAGRAAILRHDVAVRAVDWCGKVVATGDWAGNVHLSVIGEA